MAFLGIPCSGPPPTFTFLDILVTLSPGPRGGREEMVGSPEEPSPTAVPNINFFRFALAYFKPSRLNATAEEKLNKHES